MPGRNANRYKRAIPACAGRTWPLRLGQGVGSGHPRVCGENVFLVVAQKEPIRAIPACAGRTLQSAADRLAAARPSPRVRGEPSSRARRATSGHPRVCGENGRQIFPLGRLTRAIPACAGRTEEKADWFRIRCGPSPRVRGERPLTAPPPPRTDGPSPRVRGERNTQAEPHRAVPGHPRVCGENHCSFAFLIMVVGPSPRVRGERSAKD